MKKIINVYFIKNYYYLNFYCNLYPLLSMPAVKMINILILFVIYNKQISLCLALLHNCWQRLFALEMPLSLSLLSLSMRAAQTPT